MLRTLYAKLAVGLLVLLIAMGAIYTAINLTVTDRYLRQLNQQVNRHLARNLVADRNLVEQGRLNEAALKETFSLYMSINPSIEIYLLDSAGGILSYSADPEKIKRRSVSLQPIRAFLRMEDPYPLLGDDPRSHDRQKAFSVTEIPGNTTPEGYLYVVLRGEQYDSAEALARTSYLLRLGDGGQPGIRPAGRPGRVSPAHRSAAPIDRTDGSVCPADDHPTTPNARTDPG
jgi:hypothetical protein